MKLKVLKIWSVVSTILVIIIVLFALFLMGSRIMGYRVFNVTSGSMSPTYEVGDLIYVKTVDPESVEEGDPITFVLNENLVVATHRVVRIDAENQQFYTKGDANDTIDSSPVHYKNLIGVPQYKIPKLGYVSDYIQNPPGMYVTIGICVVLIFMVFLPDIIEKRKKKKNTLAAESIGTSGTENVSAETKTAETSVEAASQADAPENISAEESSESKEAVQPETAEKKSDE